MKMKSVFLWGAILILSGSVFAQDVFQTCIRDVNSILKIRVSFDVSRDNLLKTKPYVDENLRVHFPAKSTVKVRVFVNSEGKVVCALYQEGHPLLSAASLDAARQLRYRPYILNGKPVAVETTVVFNYSKGEFKVQ
jgi:Gram-negative bacterial TonB protein C-terminal